MEEVFWAASQPECACMHAMQWMEKAKGGTWLPHMTATWVSLQSRSMHMPLSRHACMHWSIIAQRHSVHAEYTHTAYSLDINNFRYLSPYIVVSVKCFLFLVLISCCLCAAVLLHWVLTLWSTHVSFCLVCLGVRPGIIKQRYMHASGHWSIITWSKSQQIQYEIVVIAGCSLFLSSKWCPNPKVADRWIGAPANPGAFQEKYSDNMEAV